MNRSDLIQGLATRLNATEEQSTNFIDAFCDIVKETLSAGEEVAIKNFGVFEPRQRKAVSRRVPSTGEVVDVPAKRSVGFRAAPSLKGYVNKASV